MIFQSIRTLAITGTVLAISSACSGGTVPLSSASALGSARAPLMSAKAGAALYVANNGATNVTVYGTDGDGPKQTIKNGLRLQLRAITFDSASNVYVAMAARRGTAGAVNQYAKGKSRILRKIKVVGPVALAVDGADNLYVLGHRGVEVFAPGASTPSITITNGIKNPTAMILDKSGNIYVGNGENAESVTIYSSTGNLIRTITNGVYWPQAMAFDKQGRLYVANGPSNDTVTVYQPGKSTVWKTISGAGAALASIALDAEQNVYVAAEDSNSVSVFSAAPNFALATTIKDQVNAPDSLALDVQGDLFVANSGSSTVTKYLPGSSEVDATISNGIDVPIAIKIK